MNAMRSYGLLAGGLVFTAFSVWNATGGRGGSVAFVVASVCNIILGAMMAKRLRGSIHAR